MPFKRDTPFNKLEWSLIPGPAKLNEIEDSQFLHEIAEYSPVEIATAMLAIKNVQLVSDSHDWWKWRARYESKNEMFDIGMTLFGTDEVLWGGSDIISCSNPASLLWLWREIRKSHGAVWLLGPECGVWPPDIFENEYVI